MSMKIMVIAVRKALLALELAADELRERRRAAFQRAWNRNEKG